MKASMAKHMKTKGIFAKDTHEYANILLSQSEIRHLQSLSTYKIIASTADLTPS